MNSESIVRLLDTHNIPHDSWGTGKAKTLTHLIKEVLSGESVLVESGKMLFRQTTASSVRVVCSVHGQLLHLYEEKQVFAHGRVRSRPSLFDASVVEKSRPSESPHATAVRAIEEELGIRLPHIKLRKADPYILDEGPTVSESYPGLLSQHKIHRYLWDMPLAAFKKEGYVEVQEDKTTYFNWYMVE